MARPTTPAAYRSKHHSSLQVWAHPRSLATTRGILSFPRGTEMFQFPRCPPPGLCVQPGVTAYHRRRVSSFGNPRISLFGGSPWLIAAELRPSSARSAKASTARRSRLTYSTVLACATFSLMREPSPAAHHQCPPSQVELLALVHYSILKLHRRLTGRITQIPAPTVWSATDRTYDRFLTVVKQLPDSNGSPAADRHQLPVPLLRPWLAANVIAVHLPEAGTIL